MAVYMWHKCPQCGQVMVDTVRNPGYRVCPRGHGRLIPGKARYRLTREAFVAGLPIAVAAGRAGRVRLYDVPDRGLCVKLKGCVPIGTATSGESGRFPCAVVRGSKLASVWMQPTTLKPPKRGIQKGGAE